MTAELARVLATMSDEERERQLRENTGRLCRRHQSMVPVGGRQEKTRMWEIANRGRAALVNDAGTPQSKRAPRMLAASLNCGCRLAVLPDSLKHAGAPGKGGDITSRRPSEVAPEITHDHDARTLASASALANEPARTSRSMVKC